METFWNSDVGEKSCFRMEMLISRDIFEWRRFFHHIYESKFLLNKDFST